jgi:hypothetical protein
MAAVAGGITLAEQTRRKEAVDYARRLVESEGLNLPAFALSQAERFVAGEISQADFIASL